MSHVSTFLYSLSLSTTTTSCAYLYAYLRLSSLRDHDGGCSPTNASAVGQVGVWQIGVAPVRALVVCPAQLQPMVPRHEVIAKVALPHLVRPAQHACHVRACSHVVSAGRRNAPARGPTFGQCTANHREARLTVVVHLGARRI